MAEPLGKLIAVEIRHANVEDADVRAKFLRRVTTGFVERLGAGRGAVTISGTWISAPAPLPFGAAPIRARRPEHLSQPGKIYCYLSWDCHRSIRFAARVFRRSRPVAS
jgi:hypothetical protein